MAAKEIKVFDPDKDFRHGQRHFSHTKLETYDSCPRRYYRKHVKKEYEPRSEPLVVGGIAHALIAAYDRHLRAKGLQTDVTALDSIILEVLSNPEQKRKGDAEHYTASATMAAEAVFRQFAQTHILNPEYILHIEEQIGLDLGDGVVFWFKADRVDGIPDGDGLIGVITDYKSDWYIWSASKILESPQARDYAWGYWRAYPGLFKSFRVGYHFFRWGVAPDPVPLTLDDVREHEKHVFSRIARIEADKKFEPTPGEGCTFCGFWHDCPAVKSLKDTGGQIIIKTHDEAVQALNELSLIERQASARKDALKAWCTVNGVVLGNGVQIGFFRSGGDGAIDDAQAFAKAMQDAGKDPWPWLRGPDSRSLGKLLKSNGLGDVLQPLIRDNTSTRFAMKKLSGEGDAA